MKPPASLLVLAAAVAVAAAGVAGADERRWYDRVQLSAYVDVYYALDTNSPETHESFYDAIGTTAKKHNEFSLNLAALDISVSDPVIMHFVFNIGTATEVLHANEPLGRFAGPEAWKYIQQAYVGYKLPLGRGLKIEGGIFPSHLGYEVFPSKDNWNYTRSWMAEESPYYETGIRVTYPFSDALSVQLLYLNGWQIIGEDNGWKTFGSQIQYAKPRYSLWLNTEFGPEQPHEHDSWRFFFDGIASFDVSTRLKLAATLDYGFEMLPAGGGLGHWVGAALYVRVQLIRWLAAAARGEVYWDGLGAAVPRNLTGLLQTIGEGTLTLEARAADMIVVKLEARYDQSTQPVFDAHGASRLTNLPNKSDRQGLFVLGAVAYF